MLDLSVVIPARNEADSLLKLNAEIEEAINPLGKSYEVIMVDDGSSAVSLPEIVNDQSAPAIRSPISSASWWPRPERKRAQRARVLGLLLAAQAHTLTKRSFR